MEKLKLTIDQKIARFQEKVSRFEVKRKELVKKQEDSIKNVMFQTVINASKKNTTILDLILEKLESNEQEHIKGFFKQMYKIKFTTPVKPIDK